ncbi:Response regulator rcp1 [Rubripirellula obstinata]|uniref:Response regulator rcp1 n=1 Tax=Rubripirellula obstinata TaxID=406547 RepID=A0A5B1CGS8_9BACT|nr:response regulator [Rubripirellula obstinata]KAA1259411.1 Response regulator rcp1 [Rubripirellula obstinata]
MPRRNEVTVLLVEDDDLDAEAVRRSFDKNEVPAKLQRAESGLQALDILRAFNTSDRQDENACIVFLDLNMPGVNGHDFLTELRSDPRLKKIPVFILTTSDHARDIEKAYAQNVAGYFTKSHLSDLIVVLNQYIDSARLPSLE